MTKLFLSNIINHGESDVQWQISILDSHLSVLWLFYGKRKQLSENGQSWSVDGFECHVLLD